MTKHLFSLLALIIVSIAFVGCGNKTSSVSDVAIITEETTWNDKTCVKQSASLDLNNDGKKEEIAVYFMSEYEQDDTLQWFDFCDIVITEKNGTHHSTTWYCAGLIPTLNFADFDTNDGLIQFYFESQGYDSNPYTKIFSFDGTQIVSNTGFPGTLTSYDGSGRIYSSEIYSVNCYYDLTKGLTPLPKENIIGTFIQRDFNILLCSRPIGLGFTYAILSEYYEGDGYKNYIGSFEDEFICIVPPNTSLEVLDIEFQFSTQEPSSKTDELNPVPWLKVKTPDGAEGWFNVFYTGFNI